jgi:small subunit ribosomal protein S17
MADEEKIENETPEETPVEEPTAEVEAAPETPVEEPVAETPAEEPVAETPVEEPVAEAEPAGEEPVAEEPVAEAEPAEPEATPAAAEPEPEATPAAAAAEPAAPAPQSQPKQKHKRLPRALRPKKGRRQRVPAAERKAISREPKPEHDRGRRQERRGVVVSDAMDKTIVVKVDTIRSHPRYKKVIRRSVKFHAHDEQNSAKVGDVVRIVETRPLSATKNWRLVEIVEVAK